MEGEIRHSPSPSPTFPPPLLLAPTAEKPDPVDGKVGHSGAFDVDVDVVVVVIFNIVAVVGFVSAFGGSGFFFSLDFRLSVAKKIFSCTLVPGRINLRRNA